MFKTPFSFNGRIRRTEYGISCIIYFICYCLILAFTGRFRENQVLLIFLIPVFWFLWAQNAKRCHDIGNSGWWQLIPFYVFVLLFKDGDPFENQYGENPKGNAAYDAENYQDPMGTAAYQNSMATPVYQQPIVDPLYVDPAVVIAADIIDDTIVAAEMAEDDAAYQNSGTDDSSSWDDSTSDDSGSSDADYGMDSF